MEAGAQANKDLEGGAEVKAKVELGLKEEVGAGVEAEIKWKHERRWK